MIKVEKIMVKEFRGIRELTLDLKGKNFAICGPNGTGKSGVVDALEFGLTGGVSRLSGKGRGTLSIKAHGPHVDSRDHPERAQVALDIVIPSLGNKKVRVVRTVKNPSTPTITPGDADVLAVLKRVEAHPEFVLSRREIIKYVLAEPGERSKEIQALLQLEDLETVRATLLKIANATEKELRPLDQARTAARDALVRSLGITEPTPEAVLAAANAKRALLSLPALAKLEPTTSIRDGLESLGVATPNRIVKATAKADLAAAKAALAACKAEDFAGDLAASLTALKKLQENEASLQGMSRDDMLKTALELFDDAQCPVCETPWEPERFKAIVNGRREQLAIVIRERKAAEALLEPVIAKIGAVRQTVSAVAAYGPMFATPIDVSALTTYAAYLASVVAQAGKFLPLDETIAILVLKDSAGVDPALAAVGEALEAIPEPTERDSARDFLFVGQERLQVFRIDAAKHAGAKRRAAVAKKVFETYGTASTAALESIYQQVELEFREFYRAINNDDESTFEAQLTPSIGKLGFEVNFYGRGFFPPGAYHSEGHQDGMGLCLYLALMKHLLGGGFTFAVLDDVLMSVDIGHRREVCALLKATFPGTQFILTTHDGVWLRHMKTVGLIEGKAGIEFRKWNVDQGPSEWKDIDLWAEIDGDVGKNEIRAAAGLVRFHLEHLAAEYCAHLGARVEYKEDGRYELGDLLPSAITTMRSLLKESKAAANSWGNVALVAAIGEFETRFSAAATTALVDQWQINPSVHYNEWANLGREDFAPVVAAFKALAKEFACEKCGGLLYLVKVANKKNLLRCDCSAISFSLTAKAA